MKTISKTDTVLVHYTGTLVTGEVFASTKDSDPETFELGKGKLIAGMEKGLLGLKVGEKKRLEISFKEAYGDIKQELFMQVPRTNIPAELELKVGAAVNARNSKGERNQVFITKIMNDSIIVDANHPLAGRDLIFEIEIVEIL